MVSCGGGSGDGMRERSRSRDDSPAVPAAPRTAPPDDFYAEQVEEEEIQRKMIQWMTTLVQLDPMLISCPMCSRRLTSLRRTSSIRTCCMTWASGGSSGDFDRAVQPKKGQCTPDEPHGHWVCPANLIGWRFD